MKKLLFILFIFLVSCEKDEPELKNFIPEGKNIYNIEVLAGNSSISIKIKHGDGTMIVHAIQGQKEVNGSMYYYYQDTVCLDTMTKPYIAINDVQCYGLTLNISVDYGEVRTIQAPCKIIYKGN